MKRCTKCREMKAEFLFPINKQTVTGHSAVCKRCENRRQKKARDVAKDWKYPYKGLNGPKYIEDRGKLFMKIAKQVRKGMGLNW